MVLVASVAPAIHDAINGHFHLPLDSVVAFIRDGASTNSAACNILRGFYRKALDLKCTSHAAANIGKLLFAECDNAKTFVSRWNSLMNSSDFARHKFATLIHADPRRYSSDIRWFYQQKVCEQVFKYWGHCLSIITDESNEFAEDIRIQLKTLVQDLNSMNVIQLELAIMLDCGGALAKLCYKQEGDGFLVCTTYDHWNETLLFLQHAVFDGSGLKYLDEVLSRLFQNDEVHKKRLFANYCQQVIRPCLEKMKQDTHERLKDNMDFFRACRLFDYCFVASSALESLCVYDVGTSQVTGEISWLIRLPRYMKSSLFDFAEEIAEYKDIAVKEMEKKVEERVSHWEFWKRNQLKLPNFHKAAAYVAICAPSSATVERLFSLLCSFTDQQRRSKADYIKASVMQRYNNNMRLGTNNKQDEYDDLAYECNDY